MKNRPSPHLVTLLNGVLERFLASSRYPMLELLVVNAFTTKESKLPKSISLASFGSLAERGADKIATSPGVTAIHLTRLMEIVNSLLDGDNSAQGPHIPAPTIPSAIPLRPKAQTIHRMNSVEAEERLSTALSKIRMSPRLPAIALNRVGDYWQEDWIRAPFEEALTLEQLAKIKPRALLDKKSFTQQKLLHLIEAINRALASPGVTAPSEGNLHASSATSKEQPSPSKILVVAHSWKSQAASLPAPLAAAILQFEHEVSSSWDNGVSISKTLPKFTAVLGVQEYLAATLLEEYEPALVSSMLKIDHETVLETSKSAYRKIEQLIKENSPEVHQSLLALLGQPAIALTTLSEVLFARTLSESFRMTLTAMIARSLGGAPVEAFSARPVGLWSRNQSGLERAIKLLISGLPKSDSELRADAHAIIPGIPFETIATLLKPFSFYKEKELTWSKKGSL